MEQLAIRERRKQKNIYTCTTEKKIEMLLKTQGQFFKSLKTD